MWRDVLSCAGLGDEKCGLLGPRLKLGAGGRSPEVSAGMVDRPSKRQSGTRRAAKSKSGTPAWHGGSTIQASVGPGRRPSRALLRPVAGEKVKVSAGATPQRPAPPPLKVKPRGRDGLRG